MSASSFPTPGERPPAQTVTSFSSGRTDDEHSASCPREARCILHSARLFFCARRALEAKDSLPICRQAAPSQFLKGFFRRRATFVLSRPSKPSPLRTMRRADSLFLLFFWVEDCPAEAHSSFRPEISGQCRSGAALRGCFTTFPQREPFSQRKFAFCTADGLYPPQLFFRGPPLQSPFFHLKKIPISL